MKPLTQKIVPHLWFDGTAEQAGARYADLLPGSGVGHIGRYSQAGSDQHGQLPGSVMSLDEKTGCRAIATGPQGLIRG